MKRRDICAYESYLARLETAKRRAAAEDKDEDAMLKSTAASNSATTVTSGAATMVGITGGITQQQGIHFSTHQPSPLHDPKRVTTGLVGDNCLSAVVGVGAGGMSSESHLSQATTVKSTTTSATTIATTTESPGSTGTSRLSTSVAVASTAASPTTATCVHSLPNQRSTGVAGTGSIAQVDATLRATLLAAATAALRGRGGGRTSFSSMF
jgi:hypothetical protein